MKVKELKEGMLLHAKLDLAPVQQTERARPKIGTGLILEKSTIRTVRFKYAPLSSRIGKTVFMYLGSKKDSYKWEGVYKHHRILLGGQILHLSGYDVKHIEPAKSI